MQSKITVIIPVFKVEKFIDKCMTSLMAQTINEVEYIVVDDASPDSSIEIVKKHIAQHPEKNIKILTHEVNKGLPAARNTGLQAASGEYIYHCDSDDFLESNALEAMYNAAKENEADYVWCDWFLSYETKERLMNMPSYPLVEDAVQSMLCGGMKYNVWNKLVAKKIYTDNNITFPDGHGMGEDMTMIMLAAHATKVYHVCQPLYHYVRLNTEAFSQVYSPKHLQDLKFNADRIINYFINTFGDKYDKELNLFKLEVKFPFLISSDTKKYIMWSEWYPEANKYIGENKYISRRSKFLQKMAAKSRFKFLKSYNYICYKIIYTHLFR